MTAPSLLPAHNCVGLGRRSLHQLRVSLERETGLQSAAYLQEAGFAGGEEVYSAFADWLNKTHGIDRASGLDIEHLAAVLSDFFQAFGWGTLATEPLGDAVMAIDSGDWSEALPGGAAMYPSCHFSSGLFADFFSRLSNGSVGVMEVECRTRGDARCRFLAGAPETLHVVYERMTHGLSYAQALGMETT